MTYEYCRNGHEMTPQNIYQRPGEKYRHCRTCRREVHRLYKGRPGALPPPPPGWCRKGHQLTEQNTYINPVNGQKKCKDCIRSRQVGTVEQATPPWISAARGVAVFSFRNRPYIAEPDPPMPPLVLPGVWDGPS